MKAEGNISYNSIFILSQLITGFTFGLYTIVANLSKDKTAKIKKTGSLYQEPVLPAIYRKVIISLKMPYLLQNGI